MSRRTLGLAGLLLLPVAALPEPVTAQLGGLTKKARDKAAQATGVQQPTTDQPARMPGPTVTTASVNSLLKGLQAEAAAIRQRAAEEQRRQARDSADREAAKNARDCPYRTRDSLPLAEEVRKGLDSARIAAEKGDYARAGQISMRVSAKNDTLTAQVEKICARQGRAGPAAPQPDAQAMQQATGSPDSVGAKAAGLSLQEYAEMKELVYTHIQLPGRAGLTPAEKAAVEPKKKELRDALRAVGIG